MQLAPMLAAKLEHNDLGVRGLVAEAISRVPKEVQDTGGGLQFDRFIIRESVQRGHAKWGHGQHTYAFNRTGDAPLPKPAQVGRQHHAFYDCLNFGHQRTK